MKLENAKWITVVSGLPRSGTSMMMRMLSAGGMPILADDTRPADEDNPFGYYELEAAKGLRNDRRWLQDAVGKAVKVVHLLLPELPKDHAYRVVMMRRDLGEVLASQRAMLQHHGRRGAELAPEKLAETEKTVLEEIALGPEGRMGDAPVPGEVAQPLFFTVQVALGALWRSWGFEPECIAGDTHLHRLAEEGAS